MDNRPIGVFDSGLGGLTVVRRLLELLPAEDIVYFGDTGRVPYGTRSRETIEKYAEQDCRFLMGGGVKRIIAACGTVSSTAPGVLERLPVPACGPRWPRAGRGASGSSARAPPSVPAPFSGESRRLGPPSGFSPRPARCSCPWWRTAGSSRGTRWPGPLSAAICSR